MAVYDGAPSIRLEGDHERALALIPEAKALLYEVQKFLRISGVNTFSMTRRVDAESHIYVLCAGGQNIISITVAPEVPEVLNPVTSKEVRFPDFYSGVVYNGYYEKRTKINQGVEISYYVCSTFQPTESCRIVQKNLVPAAQDVQRLAVLPDPNFLELQALPAFGKTFTQYTKLRSSMYSGLMKKVAQVVMGMGKIDISKFRQLGKVDTAYMREVETSGLRIRYDWRFTTTHGIRRAEDGNLWLIEISLTRGVLARLLPIFPESRTTNFRAKAIAKGDIAMQTALDELGCLPTGETFPAREEDLQELIDKGEVLQLASAEDLEPFYECSSYSSYMGWAFDDKGFEAYNTAYKYDEEGFQKGVMYAINIFIGPLKLFRQPNEPIAEGSAALRLMEEGYLYAVNEPLPSPARYLPIKFYEPFLDGLLSHVGTPALAAQELPAPKVDTPMFCAFVNGRLQVVRYYRNPVSQPYNQTSDPRYPGECLLAGSWEIVTTSGNRSFTTMMYSNTLDFRRVLQESETVTNITSNSRGFQTPRFSDFIQSPEASKMWRERLFQQVTEVDSRSGERVLGAVAIPQFSREAYYFAFGSQYAGGRSGSTSVTHVSVRDPNVGYGWRYFPRINSPYSVWPDDRGCEIERCGGNPAKLIHPERRVVCDNYEPNANDPAYVHQNGGIGDNCHEFADEGPWFELCDSIDGIAVGSGGATGTHNYSENWNLGTDDAGFLYLFTPGTDDTLRIPVTFNQVDNHWMKPSPDPVTEIVQNISAMHNAIGQDVVVYATGLTSYSGEVKVEGFTHLGHNLTAFPAIVGVYE